MMARSLFPNPEYDFKAELLARVYALVLSWDVPGRENPDKEEPPAATTGGNGKEDTSGTLEISPQLNYIMSQKE